MVQILLAAPRPTHELGIAPDVLDMTATAGLLPVFSRGVQPLALANPKAQILVAAKAGVGVEALAGRMAFAAVRVAVDLRVGASELAGRQELGARRSGREGATDRCCDHQAAQERKRLGPPGHVEKIQR